jgi:hypothetical protein
VLLLIVLAWTVSHYMTDRPAEGTIAQAPVAKQESPATPPPAAPAEKAADPAPAESAAQTAAATPEEKAPEASAPETKPAEVKPAEVAPAEPVAVTPPAPVAPPPPPPASMQFKAAIEALKISGVRGGANPRVFIERTSYGVGDIVNPQLGITFAGYSAQTHMLSFKDGTGAIVERRN